MMKMALATSAFAAVLATGASAATIDYDLFDHPDGANAGFAEYGIRLDTIGLYFSFDNPEEDQATLSIDVDNQSARMYGDVLANSQANDDEGVWTIDYYWTGVTINDAVNGYFTSLAGGYGTLTDGFTTYYLDGMGVNDPNYGYNFQFGEDHRLSQEDLDNGFGPAEGWGWINVGVMSEECEVNYQVATDVREPCIEWRGKDGANDFLFTAQLGGGDDNPNGEIPLPAAGWMLLAGVGALRVMRKKKAA